MKSTWQHRWNRLVRRRGGLPKSARLPRTKHGPAPRRRAFARARFGRYEINLPWRRLLWRVALGVLAVGAVWVGWQSWVGLGVFNH